MYTIFALIILLLTGLAWLQTERFTFTTDDCPLQVTALPDGKIRMLPFRVPSATTQKDNKERIFPSLPKYVEYANSVYATTPCSPPAVLNF
jgi:hypothetical protein